MAAAVPSTSGSPASSVDSAELQSLLVELNILPAAAAIPLQQQQWAQQQGRSKRRFVLDSDLDGEFSPSSSRPQATPRLDDSTSQLAAASAAALPVPPQQQQVHRGRAPPAPANETEVIEILDSSSDEEDEEEWRISAPATSQKQRCAGGQGPRLPHLMLAPALAVLAGINKRFGKDFCVWPTHR